MIIADSQLALSDDDFKKLGGLVGADLPASFILHYKFSNGGYPEENHVKGEESDFSFQGFFPIRYGQQTVETIHADILEWGVVDKFIPFGFDDGGNVFYISLEPCFAGNVLLLTADSHDVFKVCNSFDFFLNALEFRDA
ncbi:SMI1/KNR4 family protein [Chitinilyticum litopenaei]|uniref:SMI1/KNR4 family protein n=1 Tax=Chitinilyticum litopenaei TaxID=1121276 RepID=UPI0009DB92BC|nr:SMI1/KNR4 family protein [Chitinilyticum litopenaei]